MKLSLMREKEFGRRSSVLAAIAVGAVVLAACSSPGDTAVAANSAAGDAGSSSTTQPQSDTSTETGEGSAGDGQTATDSGVAQFEEIAKKYLAPITAFPGPTTGPAAQKGKNVVYIACGFAGEGCLTAAQGAEAAGKALGWNVELVDGKFDPSVFTRSIQQAIDRHVDAIVIDAIDADAIKGPLAQARKAGIVVASYDSNNTPSDTGVSFDVKVSFEDQGRAMASYMIWKTDGKAAPFILNSPEFKGTVVWTQAAVDTFKQCATCSIVETYDFTATTAATALPPLVVSEQKRFPNMNVLLVPYDAAALPIVPSMDSAGILDKVKVGVFNATTPTVAFIRQGKEEVSMAEPQAWGAWATMDNLNRVFAGEEPVEQNIPIRLINKDNVDSIPEGQAWEGDVDYKAAYSKIWNG